MYFIDRLALRAGNEKGEEEADTVGCCSLRYEHVMLEPPNKLIFDFLGKDSIRYYNVVEVEPQIFKNIRIFKGDGKGEGDALFDRVSVGCSLHSLCAVTDYSGHTDRWAEQASDVVYEGTLSQGVPYLQRLDHLPEAARREHAQERGYYSKACRIQRREPHGGYLV
jgi:hypothetical protein